MIKSHIQGLKLLTSILWIAILSACAPSPDLLNNLDEELVSDFEIHQYDMNQYQLNKVVCDPLSAPGNPGINDGLLAELFYLENGQEKFRNVQDYIDKGKRSTQTLFFSDLNIPTRIFEQGFPTQTGSVIKNDLGEDLVEYFAIRFKSVLHLSPDQEEGHYELALLSDDGSVMRVIDADGARVVVDNDHDHPTRMGCGETLYFDKDTEYDIQIDYYQGPRNHIALIPLWRRVTDNTSKEKECGKLGNGRFFHFNKQSLPTNKYTDMLLRGWQPISAVNWTLPAMAIFNPCKQGTNPKISDFIVEVLDDSAVLVTWRTDIPASSQVLIRDKDFNERITNSDNILRTSHRILIKDLNVDEYYTLQGVSISRDMGKTLSRVRGVSF